MNKNTKLSAPEIAMFSFIALLIAFAVFFAINENAKGRALAKKQILDNYTKGMQLSGEKIIVISELNEAVQCLSKIPKKSDYYPQAQERLKLITKKLNEPIIIHCTTKYLCEDCGKPLKKFVKPKKVKRIEQNNYPDKEIKQGICLKCKQKRIAEALQAKRAAYEARVQERKAKIEKMQEYEGGDVKVAVGRVEIATWKSDGYTGYTAAQGHIFLGLGISVLNKSSSTVHANPTYFTLSTPDGYTVNYDNEVTLGLTNYFDAVNLPPDGHTYGWLFFHIPKADKYVLHYNSGFGSVDKEIIPVNI